MMKKSSVVLLIFFFMALQINAQTEIDKIKKDFLTYNKLIKDKKYKRSLDYINPDFFNYFPKEELLKGMEQTMENESLIYEFKAPIIKTIHRILNDENKQYASIEYDSNFNIKFKDVDNYSEKELEAYKKYYISIFEKEFGKGNVIFNLKTRFFEIKSHNFAIASSDKGKNTWKFLQIDPNLGDIYRKIFSPKILDQLDIIKE